MSVHETERMLFFILAQLIVILIAARAVGYAASRIGQSRVVGEIVAGLVLGPSLLGVLFPGIFQYLFHSVSVSPITIISQIGLILLMFQIGMDFDFSHLRENRNRKAVILISVNSILLPFSLGVVAGVLSAPHLAPEIAPLPYSLFLGTALSITAVPVLGRIMTEMDLTRTRIGAIAISAAAINDVTGWIILAAITAIATAQFSASVMAIQLTALVSYGIFAWWVARPFLRWAIARFDDGHGRLSPNLMALMLALMFISSIATQSMGIFSIFGGFVLGVLVHNQHRFVSQWKKSVGDFVIVFFLPVFFTYTGLRTDITGLDTIPLWGWCLGFLGTAIFGKFGGAFSASRVAGLDALQASAIGIMMNTRGLMELIVLNVGFDLGFIPKHVFTMLVIMAVVTTVTTAPLLRRILPRIGHAVPHGIDA